MVNPKSLITPKVIFPFVGIVMLITVTAMIAVFYVRNPTVADNLFGGKLEDEMSTQAPFSMQSSDDQGGANFESQTVNSILTTRSAPSTISTSNVPHTHSTNAPNHESTPMHAIEPVAHL